MCVCVCVCVCVCNFAKIFRYLKFILKILSPLKKYFLYPLGFDFFIFFNLILFLNFT